MYKYNIKKSKNQTLVKWIGKHLKEEYLNLIYECGTYLEFYSDVTLEHKKLNRSNFCKNRFCPLCSWRKARKDALKISILLKYLKDTFDYEFLFLTLTAPNVPGDKLNDEIKEYTEAFRRLTKRKEFEKMSMGFVRKLEVTYNRERDDFHPHLHVMIAVKKSYFTSRDYISKKKFLEIWKECKRDRSITQVDVKKMNIDDDNAIFEISKYGAKDSDYLLLQDIFDTFYKALKGKRLITYSGAFKDALKLFDDKKLEHYKEIDFTQYIYRIAYSWNKDYYKYIQYELEELTEDEKEQINNKSINEIDID